MVNGSPKISGPSGRGECYIKSFHQGHLSESLQSVGTFRLSLHMLRGLYT